MEDAKRQLKDSEGTTRSMLFETALSLLWNRAGSPDVLGTARDLASDVYRRCLVGDAQPGSWLEVPLLGDPGFDMNVYYRRDQMRGHDRFVQGDGFGYQPLVDWLSKTPLHGFGIGLAFDLMDGELRHGAYVNPNNIDSTTRDGFFRAIRQEQAGTAITHVASLQPEAWTPMEVGVLASRVGSPARIASHVHKNLQRAYAEDTDLLAKHLRQTGFTALEDDMLSCLQEMAASPFEFWLELDVLKDGSVGDALGADLLFGGSSVVGPRADFSDGSPASLAMTRLQDRGLADERWHVLADAFMARLVPLPVGDEGPTFFFARSEPTFVKAKWVPGKPPMAKIYQSLEAKLLG